MVDRAKLIRILLVPRSGVARTGHVDPNSICRASVLEHDDKFYSLGSITGSPGETILKYEECDAPRKVKFI